MRLQLFAIARFGFGVQLPKFSFFGAFPFNTTCHWIARVSAKWTVVNGLSKRHERDRRLTDRATDKCIVIGAFACTVGNSFA